MIGPIENMTLFEPVRRADPIEFIAPLEGETDFHWLIWGIERDIINLRAIDRKSTGGNFSNFKARLKCSPGISLV